MANVAGIFNKLPKAFLGALLGIVLGGIGGEIFASMGYIPTVPWKNVFIFLGSVFGLILGWKDE